MGRPKGAVDDFRKKFPTRYTVDRSGCWLWNRSVRGHRYARTTDGGKRDYAHRIVYRVFVGPIPDGYDVHHTCERTTCVNPAHLEAVTRRDHVLNKTPRNFSYRNARVTHCPQGHEYTAANTLPNRYGRACRACFNAKMRRWYRTVRSPRAQEWKKALSINPEGKLRGLGQRVRHTKPTIQ